MAPASSHAAESPSTSPAAESATPRSTTMPTTRAGAGAQRHAQPDLAAALRHGVGQQAVESERGQQERERGEGGEQRHLLVPVRHVERQDFVHGARPLPRAAPGPPARSRGAPRR